jgi:hypothetical protein
LNAPDRHSAFAPDCGGFLSPLSRQLIGSHRQFENDRSPVSTIVKGVKRAMAGEYSREFSARVFQRPEGA